MRVLHLVIHLDQGPYRAMYAALSEFYRLFSGVDTYFVSFAPELPEEYRIDGDRLWIRGVESLVPGILQKTIDGMLRFDLSRYDYIIRSNSSTIINFRELSKYEGYLINNGVDYLGGYRMRLAWLDPPAGIKDNRYFGTNFATGTMIVLSRRAALRCLEKRHFLDFSIIDDVAIGVFFKNVCPTNLYGFEKSKYAMNVRSVTPEQRKALIREMMENNPIAWRNKSNDRMGDAESMQFICSALASIITSGSCHRISSSQHITPRDG